MPAPGSRIHRHLRSEERWALQRRPGHPDLPFASGQRTVPQPGALRSALSTSRFPGHQRASLSLVTRAQLRGWLGKPSTPDRRGRSEPPEPKLGLSIARCGALSSGESRAPVILLANPGRRDAMLLGDAAQRRDRLGKPATPARQVAQHLPTCSCNRRDPREPGATTAYA